jgi:hypothetical protein
MSERNTTGTHSLPYTARVEPASLLVFLVPGLFLTLIVLSMLGRGPSAVLPVVLLLVLVWLFLGTLLLRTLAKIVLLPDRICYDTLFSKQEMFFADITQVEFDRVARGAYRIPPGIRAPQYLLRIEDQSSSKRLLINAKPFSKRDLSIVIDVIATHAPQAFLNEGALRLRDRTIKG